MYEANYSNAYCIHVRSDKTEPLCVSARRVLESAAFAGSPMETGERRFNRENDARTTRNTGTQTFRVPFVRRRSAELSGSDNLERLTCGAAALSSAPIHNKIEQLLPFLSDHF